MSNGGRLFSDADFRLYWTARQISTLGSRVGAVAVPVLVYTISGSASLAALCSVVSAAAYLIVGFVAGVVADRRPRRSLMVMSDLLCAALWAVLPVAALLRYTPVWIPIVVLFFASSVSTFFEAANQGALPMLVGAARIAEANAVIWGWIGVIDMIAPFIAGVLLAVSNPPALAAINAASFVLSAVLVNRIRAPLNRERDSARDGAAGTLLADIRAGLSHIWSDHGIRVLTLVTVVQSLAGGLFIALMIPWTDQRLAAGTAGWRFGIVMAAWGVGALVTSFVMSRILKRFSAHLVARIAIPLSILATAGIALTRNWVVGAICVFVWGVAYEAVSLTAVIYRQERTPDDLQSRTSISARILSYGAGWTIGAMLAAAIVKAAGLSTAVMLIPVALTVAGVYVFTQPPRISAP